MNRGYWVLDGPYFDPPTREGLPVGSPLRRRIEREQVLRQLRSQMGQPPRMDAGLKSALRSLSLLEYELAAE